LSSFADLGVPAELARVLAHHGRTEPFPIQTATLDAALAGRDLCGRAPTGSGKTLAFAIPIAARTPKATPNRPRTLILVPTRELAAQVADELRPLADAAGRRVACFYGGTPIGRDQQRLRRGVDIAIACPGRLADLVQRRDVALDDVDLVVVDEADRMADMGFLPEVRRLLDRTRADRQTLLFSATLDGDVDVLVRRYQRDPVRHEVEDPAEAPGEVRHLFWHAEPTDRVAVTGSIVSAVSSAIVFSRTKHGADRICKQLRRRGVAAAPIHGNRSQNQRQRALDDFASGRVSALVATDVAARGIHIDDVGAVIHFDPPATDKDYVHRSGRTGRAGADGVVVTLVPNDRRRDVGTLQAKLGLDRRVDPVALEQLGAAAGHAGPEGRPSGRRQPARSRASRAA